MRLCVDRPVSFPARAVGPRIMGYNGRRRQQVAAAGRDNRLCPLKTSVATAITAAG